LPGVGGARKRALLRAFGSVKRIEEATLEDLLKVPSINEKVAQEILESLRSAPG
jgi:excinuclease ABC subunit C